LSYNFTESTDDLEGSFSFNIIDDEVYDLIPLRSVIKIYEGGTFARFVGIVRNRRYAKQMTANGIKKTISFSGKSILSCISEFQISMDVRIYNVRNAVEEFNIQLSIDLMEARNIAQYMKVVWDFFLKVSSETNQRQNRDAGVVISNTQVAEIIDLFVITPNKTEVGEGDGLPFVSTQGDTALKYNISSTFMNQGNNSVADAWRNTLPERAYELYGYCDNKGNPRIMARLMPFGYREGDNDWGKLNIYAIRPFAMVGYELNQDDEKVYTAFNAHIIGSQGSRQFWMAIGQINEDTRIQYENEKVAVYGFRPLEVDFRGYSRGSSGNTTQNDFDQTQKLNQLLRYWYGRNDDMYNGSITMITDFKEPHTNPRIGCRLKFLEGEFYINKTEHSWSYGGVPTIKLSISRGFVYDDNGVIKNGKDGVMKNVGRGYKELKLSSQLRGNQ
jgi:hypothetical protein